ncbi:MAG: RagB/SusD family nutrient uptake outer membrane protein, partial [Flavihumibacter sp.]
MTSNRYFPPTWMLVLVMAFVACKKDYTNPNQPTTDEVFASDRAATAVAGGLQRVYSLGAGGSLYCVIDANGFTTNELILRNAGNTGELQLSTGGSAVDATNTVLLNIWTKSNKIIYDADNVINFAATMQDGNYASGMIGFASIYKALSIGNMAMFWEKIPDTTGATVGFIDRMDGFRKAMKVLDFGISSVKANEPNSAVLGRLPTEVNIINTLYALKARYAVFSGDNQGALAAAEMVDLSKTSTIAHNALGLNAVYESATSTNNVFQPVDSTLGLPAALAPDLSDKRIPFYIGINTSIDPRYRIAGFFASSSAPVPLYLPGEIMLIKAEALARLDRLPEALQALNAVRTKTPATDIYGVGAGLAAFASTDKDEILTEIYRQRCIEL